MRGDILTNFAEDDVVINVTRLLLASTMVFTFPMEHFVARHVTLTTLFGHAPSKYASPRFYLVTLALWSTSTALGVALTELGPVLELTGAVSGAACQRRTQLLS